MMTIRVMNFQYETKSTMADRIDESDAESFHSAISTVTKGSCKARQQQSSKRNEHPVRTDPRILKQGNAPTRPRSKTACSQRSASSQKSQSRSRPSSLRQDSIPIPRRRTSLPRQKQRTRRDSATLHLQSCQLFSSLNGMLAMSRDVTPLPSLSSSRTTTRHASLVPDGTFDADGIQRVCEKIDARLATAAADPFAYGYSGAGSVENSPTLSSGFHAPTDEHSSLLSRAMTVPSARTPQRPQLDTVISWTSNATRRTEYEKIDRANRGVRGFVRRVWPQCLRKKNGRRGFFTGDCDGDSVRRFRMDVSDADADADDDNDSEIGQQNFDHRGLDEKMALELESPAASKGNTAMGNETLRGKEAKPRKPWLSCFDL
ncbi:hypothetical protein PV04_07204 [Phialophora macrospora]|uniref:Uncharacterized protein n=1 Tax=Phialophora macrospora TaxID=1851006 RepID=A0A0D2FDG0_9EURO|nr:hypothetical protein PV04_07204 [Phialophora macrospora]